MRESLKFNHKEFQEKLEILLDFLEIPYKNILHYIQAFVHRSILNEKISDFKQNNERLEFFWDAVLELIITELLFFEFPEKEEWELTDLRSSLVKWKNLALIAFKLNLNQYLILSKWEYLVWWNNNPYILANTLEAFLWALYIDLGYEFTKKFIEKYVFSTLDEILKNSLHIDPKSKLQELIQSKNNFTPDYRVINESWLDHNKTYDVWVYFNEKLIWQWFWSSKKKAEKKAAENALENLDTWFN